MRESLSEENGFELLFDNARQKQENQFKAIRTFIQQDVDYIVLAPVTETGWESVLEEARAAGIPVIIVEDASALAYTGQHVVVDTQQEQIFGSVAVVPGNLTDGDLVQRHWDGAHAVLGQHLPE